MNRVLRHLRRAALLTAGDALTDAQLLEAFLTRHEEAAFEALLRRHGPMVLGVCRRVLRNCHDAEDAFQATFLVLARKAGSVRSLSGWLYGVAYRTAMKARALNAKRRAKERRAASTARPEAAEESASDELLARLDHELNRLPEKYRVAVVLCELEGKTRREAARLLGLPEGTLSSRLAQARNLLARRLSRHGTALSGGAVAALLCRGAAPAGVPPPLLASTAKAGVALAAGQALAAGAVPAQVVALTEGVMKAMLLSKLKVGSALAVVLAVAVSAGAGLTYRAAAQGPVQARFVAEDAAGQSAGRPAADELEAVRLEIEALRKEMRAMRERMNAMEARVQRQERRGEPQQTMEQYLQYRRALQALPRTRLDTRPAQAEPPARMLPYDPTAPRAEAQPAYAPGPQPPAAVSRPAAGSVGQQPQLAGVATARQPRGNEAADPLSAAEAALMKLRANPGDSQAADALGRALKRLKEQRKPARSSPPENNPQ
jgi:RNA polymerase sigma factor (sigma-70 family)